MMGIPAAVQEEVRAYRKECGSMSSKEIRQHVERVVRSLPLEKCGMSLALRNELEDVRLLLNESMHQRVIGILKLRDTYELYFDEVWNGP